MKNFIDLLQEVRDYTISHGTRIPISTGAGVFSLPLKLDYEPTLDWSLSDCEDLLKSIKSFYVAFDAYVQASEDFAKLHKEATYFSIAIQARNGDGSVPEHKHADCCEKLVVFLQSDEHGRPCIPDVAPIYYIGIGCETQSHSWPENALLALSIKGSSMRQVKEFSSTDIFSTSLSYALDLLAEER